MELLKKVILASCFLSIAISLADSLKPNEKFTGQLKLIFSMIFIVGIILSAVSADFKLELPTAVGTEGIESYESIAEAADKAVLNAAEKSVTDMVKRILTAERISFEKISANINMNADGSININEIGYVGREFERASEAVKSNMGEIEVRRLE